MKTQIEDFEFKGLFKTTTFAGWVLLIRPIIYIIFARRRDLNAYSSIDISAILFIIYSVIAFYIGIKVIFKQKTTIGRFTIVESPLKWFMLYSIIGILSMIWSVSPALTGFRAFECIAMTLLIVAVIQELLETRSIAYVFLWSLFFCTWDIFWSLVSAVRWTTNIGVLLESSQMMATTFFFMALYFTPRKWYNYLIMIMSIFSMSTVAYIGMGLGCVSAFWRNGKAKSIAVFVAAIISVLALIVGPYAILKNTIFFDKEDIVVTETSGRDHLMDVTLDCMDKYPVGLGFFSAEPYVFYAKHLSAISAHNSFFSAGLGMGYIGIALFAIFLFYLVKSVFSKFINDEYRPILIGCLCVAIMHCMGNPSVGSRVYGAWIPGMYIFALISCLYVNGKFELDDMGNDENIG